MVAESNKSSIPSPRDPGSAGDRSARAASELSVSRRVKIGIVLLLMLCGYFLMEDRSSRDAFGTSVADTSIDASQMQDFIDDLDIVGAGDSQRDPHSQDGSHSLPKPNASSVADEAFLQIPNGLRENTFETVAESPPVEPRWNRDVHHLPQTSRKIAVRPTLRFTGNIEPLH